METFMTNLEKLLKSRMGRQYRRSYKQIWINAKNISKVVKLLFYKKYIFYKNKFSNTYSTIRSQNTWRILYVINSQS